MERLMPQAAAIIALSERLRKQCGKSRNRETIADLRLAACYLSRASAHSRPLVTGYRRGLVGGAPDNGRPFFITPELEPGGKDPAAEPQASLLAGPRAARRGWNCPIGHCLKTSSRAPPSEPQPSGLATIRDHRRMRLSSIQATLHR
jgi:hypothetical protein